MKLLISGLSDACTYNPKDRTYAIRIDSLLHPFQHNLTESGLWTAVKTYSFDDITPMFGRGELFTEDTAERIILDFQEKIPEIDTLLVHCIRGKNRSPAVGIALNSLFLLGQDPQRLMEKHQETNWYVYNLLMNTGRKIL